MDRPDDDTRLIIERCPHGGYTVTQMMGQRPLRASDDIEAVLRFIKDTLEGNTPCHSERFS